MELFFLLYSIVIVGIALSASFAVAYAQGQIYGASLDAIQRQPGAGKIIANAAMVGSVVIETAGVLGVLIVLMLVSHKNLDMYGALSSVGVLFSTGILGLFVCMQATKPALETIASVARQPFSGRAISNMNFAFQSLLQTPLIFGFMVSLMILTHTTVLHAWQAWGLLIAGVTICLGSIGPLVGSGMFSSAVCRVMGNGGAGASRIAKFVFISQAMIETPIVFSAIVALLLVGTPAQTRMDVVRFSLCGLLMALGNYAPGYNSALVATQAVHSVDNAQGGMVQLIIRSGVLAQGVIDTAAIYCFVVALLLYMMG